RRRAGAPPRRGSGVGGRRRSAHHGLAAAGDRAVTRGFREPVRSAHLASAGVTTRPKSDLSPQLVPPGRDTSRPSGLEGAADTIVVSSSSRAATTGAAGSASSVLSSLLTVRESVRYGPQYAPTPRGHMATTGVRNAEAACTRPVSGVSRRS